MTETRIERSEWAAYNQLIHELIGGVVRRNTFTRLELDLLLDLQMAPIRKSSRPEMLRKYLKALTRQLAQGAAAPQRFSDFVEAQAKRRSSTCPAEPLPMDLPKAS